MKNISRILFVLAVLFVGVGTAQAQSDDLKIVKNATGVTIETYVSSTEPGTSYSASGTEAENVQHDQYLVLKVTPASGKWLYNEMLEVQVVGSPGGALAPPRRAPEVPEVKIAAKPLGLSTNAADGTGYYYYQIPSECTGANSYKRVVVTGATVGKIDLNSATISGTTVTASSDGWTATITLDKMSWPYDASPHGPAISTFTLTNGTKSFDNTAAQVDISGAQTNAGDHNATLSAVTGGCFLNSKSVPFNIAKAPTEITLNTPPGGGEVGQMYVDDTYVILKSFTPAEAGSLTYTLSKESVVTVDANGKVTAVGEGEVTITVSFAGNENYAAAEDKSMKIKVSKVPTVITVAPANPEWGDTWQLKVWDEVGIGATLTPAEAGSLSYSSSDESVVKIEAGKIKAVGAGTATITVSFEGNTKYAAAESKTITVHVIKDMGESDITLTIPTEGYTYDGTEKKPAVTVKDGEKTLTQGTDYNVSYSNNVNAGENTATVTVTDIDGGDYNVSGTKKFSIAKRPVTLTSGSKTRDYNESALTNDEVEGKNANGLTVETGWVTGQGASYTFTGTQTNVGSTPNAFTYTLNSGTIESNYKITKTEGTLTVTAQNISSATVSINPDSYFYDGTEKKPTVTVVLGGKTLVKDTDFEVEFSNNTEAGSATVTVTGKGNYTGTALGSFTITSATGDLTFGDVTKTYGNAPFEVSPSTVISPGAISYASSNTAVVTVSGNTLTIVGAGSATITATQAASGSYAEQSKTFTVTVNQAALTVTAKNHDITYGDAPANNGVDYDGFVGTEDASVLGGTLTYNNNYTQYGNVGDSYTITPGGLTSNNYTISFVSGTLKVGQREVGLNWSTPTTFTFNGSAQAPTASATNTVNGDEIGVTVTGAQTAVGSGYIATASALTGDKSGNYKLPAAKTCEFSIGEAGMSGIDVTEWNQTYDGLAHGIVVTAPTGATVKYRTAASGEYNLTESPTFTDVCDKTVYYQVTKSGYTPVTGSAKVTITKAALTVTANNREITYGDAPANNGVSYSGFVNGETSAVLGGTLTYNYNYTQYGDVGDSYTITLGGLTSDNYAISFVGGTLKVGQREVGLNWSTPTTFTFNGSAQAPTASATNTVNGDEIGVTVTGAQTAVGSGYIATASALTGDKSGNYKLPAAKTCEFSIGEAGMSGIDVTEWNQTYDGLAHGIVVTAPTGATVKYRTAASGEYNLTESPTFTDVCDKTVYYQVTKSGYTPVTGSAKVTITKAALTVTANDKEITYGEAPANNGVTYSGFVGTEGASVLGGTLAYDYDYTQYGNVGDYNITPKGLTSGNYDITFVKGTLKVNAQNISSATVNITPLSYVYDGTAKEPTVTVVLGGKTLTADTDYDVEFSDNTTPGTATVTVTGKGNYTGTATGTFKINAVTVNVSVVDIGNGDKLGGATVQVLDKDGNVVDEWVSTTAIHSIVGLKAGVEYTLRETIAPDGYTIATDCTFTIDETGKVTATGTITEGGVLLVENAKTKVKVSVIDVANGEEIAGATVQVLDKDGNVLDEWSSTTESHSIVGLKAGIEYTLRETVAPGGYTIATDITFTIDENGKVTSTGTVTEEGVLLVENTKIKTLGTIEVSPSEFTYNGQTNKPTVTAKDTDGNVIPEDQYTVSYQDSKGNALTNPTDADTYTVVITDKTGTGYDDYNVNGTATFVINKRDLTITAKEQSVNFGTAITQGTAQVLTTGLAAGQVLAAVTLSQSTTSVTTDGEITPSDAVIKIDDTDVTANYNITYKTGKLIINASTAASAVVTANDRTYDGSTQPLVTIGTITNGATGTAADVVFYESATNTTPLTSIPQVTNAGTYEIYYEVIPDGDHTAPARAKVTVTITPITAVVTIAGHNNTAVYDGKNHSVSGYNVETSTPLYTEEYFTFNGTNTAERTDAGTTNMGLTASQFTNTNTNFSEVTFNVTDGYQTITLRTLTVTANGQTIDYGTDIATGLDQVTAEGLQDSDKLTAVTLAASTSELTNNGTITPSAAVIMNGEKDVTGNYEISYSDGGLIIEYSIVLKDGYMTFCAPFDLQLVDGVKAYTVSAVSEMRGIVLTEQNAIGKGIPMILDVKTAGTYKLRKADPQNFSSVPEFVGVTDANGTDVSTINGEVYILKDGKFVWSREGVVPQYRCYVVISHAAAARSMGIVVDGETSGIDNLLLSDEEDGNWYSLDGRKLDGKPTAKGIYIMIPADGRSKGKKVMIK